MEKIERFKKRSGTTDKGKEYEDVAVASVILNLLKDQKVTNFHISSNDADFGAFDDLVLKLESDEGNEVHVKAVQLKHTATRTLSTNNLGSKKGEFSINKYYKSFGEINEDADQFILFTNRSFKCKDNAKFELEEEGFFVKTVKAKPSSELTEKLNCTYQFEIVEENWNVEMLLKIREYQKFFAKFYLYADQENVENMKKTAAEKFIKTYSSNEEIFDKFLRTISEWNIQDGNKEKLNKRWTQRVLTLQLLFSQIESLSFGAVNDNMKIFREAISSFTITLVEKKSYETVKQLWGDVGKEKNIDLKELNMVRKRYLPNIRHITDSNIGNIDPKTFAQLLWLMDRCPLVLSQCENVEKAIQLCPDTKFILVGSGKHEDWMKTYSVFQHLSNLNKEQDVREKIMQNFTVSIQGKEELDLVTLFGSDEEFLKNVTTDDLVAMLNGPCRIGGEQETLPEPYIQRYLSRNIVQITYLETVQENTIIVLNCDNNFDKVKDILGKCILIDIDKFLEKKNESVENLTNNELSMFSSSSHLCTDNFDFNKSNLANVDLFDNKFNLDKSNFTRTIYVGNRHYNDSELQQIYNENKDTKQFHYFQLLSDGNLEWIQSRGDFGDIEAYKLSNKYSMEENTLWSSRLDNSINLITADPGMGKSELMKSFKNKCPPKYWTIIIDPKNVNSFFHKANFPKTANYADLFEKFIAEEKSRSLSKLDRDFFEMCVKKNDVIYLWDALDEILSKNFDIVLNIILDLSRKYSRQWVTSRRHLKTSLEKKFSLPSLGINQFSEQEQEQYIRKRLESFISEDRMNITLEKIKSSFALVEHVDILGIPLQIFMLTELFRENSDKYLKLMENTFLLTDLYDHFIDEKCNNFYKDKIGFDFDNPQIENIVRGEKRRALDLYENVAFKVIFPEEILHRLKIDYEKCIEQILESYAGLGLVNEFQNNVPHFLHSSFAEFLVAIYFSKKIKNVKDLIADILFDAKYNNVRFFFDMLLAKNSRVHIAVLYKDYILLQTYDHEILTRKDDGGRSALHLLSSWGKRHPVVKVTGVNGEYIVHVDINFDKKGENKVYFETITYLQRKNDVSERDILLDATPLSYARKTESLGAEIKLLQTNKNELEESCVHEEIINILYYSSLLGYDDVCKLFTVEELNSLWCELNFVTTDYATTPLLLACENGNLKIVEYFVKSGVDVNRVNENGGTPLYIASLRGHQEVVEYLCTVGAEINRADNQGGTPLYAASFNGHENVVEYLVTVGAEINRSDDYGATPLILACVKGHDKVVEYLTKTGAEVNRANNDGVSPLFAASFNGHGKVVEYLTTVGAEINSATNNGRTPFFAASTSGYEQVVEYLATVGAEINAATNEGWTPLYAASYKGHEKVVAYLATFSAEVNRAGNDGTTPLIVAASKGHEKVVACLAEAGAEINRATNDGATPLIAASLSGHEQVVEYLTTVGAEINSADNDGRTPLYLASINGHDTVVEYLATVGAEINRADKEARTPLYVASMNGNKKVVEYLATVGAEINHANKDGATPLYVASRNGHEEVVEYLATVGAEVNFVANDGGTPLYAAAVNGHEKIVEYLATHGAKVNHVHSDGTTPLVMASFKGNEKVVESLVKVGAEINLAANEYTTPIIAASINGHKQVVQYLKTVGAEINRADSGDRTPLHLASYNGHDKVVEYLATVGAEINRVDNKGWTPLHAACLHGHKKVVEFLTTVGAEINRAEKNGLTPLYIASRNGHENVVEYLATVGAEINSATNDGMTPLYAASMNGHQKVVKYLATVGAEINTVTNEGWTPLYAASINGHEKVVEHLATVGAEINSAANDGMTPLYAASINGNEKVVEHLATVGAEINFAANDGMTPLYAASMNGHENVVKYLATVGAEINSVTNEGWTPLYAGCINGHEKVVEYLATVGAEINSANKYGRTPLYVASFSGHQKIVEYLTTVGAEVDRADNSGLTPLHVASINGHEMVAETLVTAGAKINSATNNGITPLYVAAISGQEKVVKYLTTVGAEIDSATNDGTTPLYAASMKGHQKVVEYLATVGAEINRAKANGATPLFIASHNGHNKVVEYLVTVGAEVNSAANDGMTPLYAASINGHQKVVECLVTAGAEINRPKANGATPLFIASLNGHNKVVEYLVTVGGEVNSATIDGITPLYAASINGHQKVVECLVTAGAEINSTTTEGRTPLYAASINAHEKVVEYLVTVGADINSSTNDGKTPLYVASQNGHGKVVEYLVTVGAEINSATSDGWTPLHAASFSGHQKVVECLVTVGAEINRVDNLGRTPLYIASFNGHENVVEYLEAVGAEINH
ncbi:uncharacterized protein LOC135123427 [Zophobas morio]|uniref:uncharacterized protein LOC135123427 n=1 Tax=Zophobas morio TaxID=2755281 RepID=UPI0030834B1F